MASAGTAPSTWDADAAVTHLFTAHYRGLVRLATLLLREPGPAEEVVQDAYVALHTHWRRLRGDGTPYRGRPQRRDRRARPARTRHGGRRAARAAGPATRGAGPALLRRPV